MPNQYEHEKWIMKVWEDRPARVKEAMQTAFRGFHLVCNYCKFWTEGHCEQFNKERKQTDTCDYGIPRRDIYRCTQSKK